MISEIIEKWIKGILIDGITGNLSGLFDNVNAKVGEIASDVGSTPQAWNSGIFNMLRSLSETVVLPIAAAILALVMCHELMFSGLLVCADCGCNLHFHFNQGNPEIKYFNCSNYKGNRGTCQSTHYIRVDFLEEVVLGEIRRLTKFASLYEDDFLKAVIGHSQQADEADRKLKEKELKALLARDEELDGLFERIYEDNVSGKISDERFSRMSRRYEDEQKELTEKIKQLRSEIEKQSSRTMTTDMFISLVRKYTRAKKLTPRMLNELVEKIEVFNAEKVNGVWEQRLRIHYNCVGTIEIPSALPLPTPDVSVNTRKGVVVNYALCDVAI